MKQLRKGFNSNVYFQLIRQYICNAYILEIVHVKSNIINKSIIDVAVIANMPIKKLIRVANWLDFATVKVPLLRARLSFSLRKQGVGRCHDNKQICLLFLAWLAAKYNQPSSVLYKHEGR